MKKLLLISATVGMLCASGTAMAFPAKDDVVVNDGEAVKCVNTRQIRSTRVVNDQTIDFDMGGGKILRNTLPNSCPSLGFEKAFSYSPTGTQLCSVDVVKVLHQGPGPRTGAACGLGVFQPIKVEPKPAEAK